MADPTKFQIPQIIRTNCKTYSRVYYSKTLDETAPEHNTLFLVSGKKTTLNHPVTNEIIAFNPGVYLGSELIDAINGPIAWTLNTLGKAAAQFESSVSATGFYQASDISKKENIREISNLDKVGEVEIVEFDWKENGKPGVGVIAQDVEKILPNLVHTEGDGSLTVNYIELLLMKIKRLELKLEDLRKNQNT